MKDKHEKKKQDVEFLYGAAQFTRHIYIIPALLLIPAAFVIYFTEGRNAIQFISIIAFAIVLTLILRALTNYSIRTLGQAHRKNESEKNQKNT